MRTVIFAASVWVAIAGSAAASAANGNQAGKRQPSSSCVADSGISLPPGFCATIFADDIGHARHMAVARNGVVYVNTWSGTYYNNATPHTGGFLVALQDTDQDGQADVNVRFGPTASDGNAGGTGIALYGGSLYAEANDRIVRYALPAGAIAPNGVAAAIVAGLPLTGDHPMHPFGIDADGNMYIDLGSATNACQQQNRMPISPGIQPCTELATRGGIWRYDANRAGQVFSPAERYATGIRNADGIAIDATGRGVFVTQHGRDQLNQNWPKLYRVEQGANLPAEELLKLERGADYGWPECYYDDVQRKLVLAPEYGGDGGKQVGGCATKREPVAVFPAHWAPNAVAIYNGSQFPKAYRNGAFIAFHGSWNRAPLPQGGYNVVFQPLVSARAAGRYVVFADGFAGADKDPGKARHRPSGVAVGADGALFISDDVGGRIWRVTYQGGNPDAGIAAARAGSSGPQSAVAGGAALPPEGIHADAGANPADRLPVPPGATSASVALGERVYRGEVGGAACAGCHGQDGQGSPVGADLTSGEYLWGDGSLAAIRKTIVDGVPIPKSHTGAMPPEGGANLTDEQLSAVAAYVWAVGHRSR